MSGIVPPSVAAIQRAVCAHYDLTAGELLAGGRTQRIAHPRQVAMYLAKNLTSRSLPQIGRSFGMHHTTILYGVRQVEMRLHWDGDTAEDVAVITQALVVPE